MSATGQEGAGDRWRVPERLPSCQEARADFEKYVGKLREAGVIEKCGVDGVEMLRGVEVENWRHAGLEMCVAGFVWVANKLEQTEGGSDLLRRFNTKGGSLPLDLHRPIAAFWKMWPKALMTILPAEIAHSLVMQCRPHPLCGTGPIGRAP